MRVEELMELLRPLPQTATVLVVIAKNVRYDGAIRELDEAREASPLSADYQHGEVFIRLIEN